MKSHLQIDELTGMNCSPVAGEFITENDAKFLRAGVTIGSSVLYNMETGISGTVTGVTETKVEATGVPFEPGQPYIVSLPNDWIVTDPADNIPIVDIECKRCGFSFPKKKLVEGYCKDCYDPPRPTRIER